MTVRDLFDNVPLREDYQTVNALEQGRCGHCGEKNDKGQFSYWCHRCYALMSLGDNTDLHGIIDDLKDISAGKVVADFLRPDKKTGIIDESKEIIDESKIKDYDTRDPI